MFNPLMQDLTKLTDTELTEKIDAVLKRMDFFARSGHMSAYNQISNIYQMLMIEQQERVIRKQNAQVEDPFDGLIDVNKK